MRAQIGDICRLPSSFAVHPPWSAMERLVEFTNSFVLRCLVFQVSVDREGLLLPDVHRPIEPWRPARIRFLMAFDYYS